jgi:acyl-CoA reductase-like NAD-dependent aldehyde dehydrogenase
MALNGDRRKHRRLKLKRTVQLHIQNGEETAIMAEIETLSPHGISISTSVALPDAKYPIVVRIPLPDRRELLEANVEKVWEVPGFSGGTNRYGLIFSGLRAVDYRLISNYINSNPVNGDPLSRRQRERRVGNPTDPENGRRNSNRRWRLPTFTLYIDGRDIDTGEYEYFPFADRAITDPKGTSEILLRLKNGEMPAETPEYIFARCCVGKETHNIQAIESSARAFEIFNSFPLAKRIKLFRDVHQLLLKNKERLLELFIAEGHPRRLGEWEFSGMLQAFTAETVSFYKSEVSKNRRTKNSEINLLLRKPDGVVCVSPPRNAASSNSLTGALALLGGNTIVLKPPLTLPISTMYLWRNVVDEALRMNGAPKGTLNIVVGNTASFINQWTNHPSVNDIVYFGESNRGLDIGKKIYAAGKKPVLELSGKDIMLVWSDANIEAATDSLMDCFLGSTQICMVPKMALIHEAVYDQFERMFIEKIQKLKVGLPSDPQTCLSPVSKIGTFFAFLEDAISKGAKLVYGGQRLNYNGESDGKGMYLEPTVIRLDDVLALNEIRAVNEETFFPLLPLVRIAKSPLRSHKSLSGNESIFKKMVDITNNNPYGLRVSAWCKSDSYIRRLVREVHNCGLLRINCRHVDFSMYLATHGGTRKTGGPFGELNYFWNKTTHLQGISIRR